MKTLFIRGLFLLVMTLLATIAYLLYHDFASFVQGPIQLSENKQLFEIKKGSGISRVANDLKTQNIIREARYFVFMTTLRDKTAAIKAGEYELTKDMTPDDLLKLFVEGKTVQYQITIIEGRSFKQIVEEIRKHPHIKQTLTEEDYADLRQHLGIASKNPEGWFYPDTYNFSRNSTDLEFLQRIHERMKKFLLTEWQTRDKNIPLKEPYEALTLASIVERESGVADERPQIAGVFYNRLRLGMKLQTDPTVIYGMGEKYKGNITRADLERDTPYNTYTRQGLTPTPIATPSAKAIKAVLHPEETEALYFVAVGDGSGAHQFTKTYAEHKKAIKVYHRNLKKYNAEQVEKGNNEQKKPTDKSLEAAGEDS